MSFFQYPFRDQDFFDKLLREHPEWPENVRDAITEYGLTHEGRDDDLEDFLGEQSFAPGIGLSLTVAQSIDNNGVETIVWDGQDFASTDLLVWDGVSTVTVGASGLVMIVAQINFAANATGYRYIQHLENAAAQVELTSIPTASASVVSGLNNTRATAVVAGDELALQAFQNSGAGLNATGTYRVLWLGSSG